MRATRLGATDAAPVGGQADGRAGAQGVAMEGQVKDEAPSDEALMEAYLAGDVSAFEQLLARHADRLFRFILRRTGDRQLAEDLFQEVLLRVVRRASSFQGQSKLTTWLYTIARNACIDAGRRAKHRNHARLDQPLRSDDKGGATLLDRVADKGPSPADGVRDRRFKEALQGALDALPEEQRDVFIMRELQGLKFREIAVVMGVPENTVKSRMRYALQGLRAQLARFEETLR